MTIIWLVGFKLPEFSVALGEEPLNRGGWLPSLVGAIRSLKAEIGLTIVCEGKTRREVAIRGVRYVMMPRNQVARFIEVEKPDVIHIHGTEGNWAAMPKDTFGSMPTVASLQGIIQGYYPHYTGALLPREVKSVWNWPNILLTRYTVFRGGEVWRTKRSDGELRAFKDFKVFLGRTEWDKAWTKYLAPGAKYYHVGEILRAPFYEGGRSEETIVPRTIYCGASMNYPLKGGHWLLRAVASLKTKYPDIKLRVANATKVKPLKGLVGWIKQGEYHRYLAKLIKELGLEKNVDLLASLTAEQVADELKKAEVFVLPSMCENSPNSLGEAMLMGCPAIATDVGGTKTILKDGEQGVLVPSGDPAILAYQIEQFFEHPEQARQYAKAAQADAEKRYDPQTVVKQLTEAYQTISVKK